MTIDMHVHYLPEELARRLRQRIAPPCIKTMPDGKEHRILPSGYSLPFSDDYTDMESRIALMDKLGVERHVLSTGLSYSIHVLPLGESLPLCRAANDDMGALCRRHPSHFSGLALLPLTDMDAAAEEYRRARLELALIGMSLPADDFASLAAAQRLAPVFEAAQELGGHVFVHPGSSVMENEDSGINEDNKGIRDATLDLQARLSQATVTLMFTEFLAPYPDVSVHVANLGGTLPFVLERIDNRSKLHRPDEPLPSDRMGRVYVDCASLGPRAIELAVTVYGADRVVFGTDYPIFPTELALEGIRSANVSDDDRRKILHENAAGLLQRFS